MGNVFQELGIVGGVFCLHSFFALLLLHYGAQRCLLAQLPLQRSNIDALTLIMYPSGCAGDSHVPNFEEACSSSWAGQA